MALSCSCDYEPEPGMKCWQTGKDFSKMPLLSRRKRCCSCKKLLEPGSDVVKIERNKIPDTDVEVRIYGEDGEIRYYLLALLGFFCLSPAIGELLLYCLDIIRQFLK